MPPPSPPATALIALIVTADAACLAAVAGMNAHEVTWRHAKTLDDALGELGQISVDAVVLDLAFDAGAGAIAAIRRVRPFAAIVALGDEYTTEAAFDAASRGAQEFLSRSSLDSNALQRAIRVAVDRLWIASFARRHADALEDVCVALPTAVCALDAEGRIALFNGEWEAIATRGSDPFELGAVDFPLLAALAEHPATTDIASGIRLTAEGVLPRFTGEVRRMEAGQERWYSLTVTRAPRSGGVLLALTDVTVSRTEAEAQSQWTAQYRDLLDNVPVGLAVHRDGRFIWVNQHLCRALGHEGPDRLLGSSARRLFQSNDGARLLAERADDEAPAKSSPPIEVRLTRADGTTLEVSASAFPVQFEGRPATLVVTRELSSERELNARMMQMDRMVSVGLLAAGLGHEINTPLSFVTANVDLALRNVAELEQSLAQLPKARLEPDLLDQTSKLADGLKDLSEALSEARLGSRRVQSIVQGLKSFSNPSARDDGPVDLERVVQAAVSMSWNELRHRARLTKEIQPTPPVVGNEAQIGQVVLNLLINAAQAIAPGKADENRVVIRVEPAGNNALLEISDTGSGISAETMERVFEPFYTTKPVGQGTGLGLAICRNSILGLGGDITVQSAVGEGTTVRVLLPTSTERRARPKSSISPLGAAPEPLCVLVVDDEPLMGRVVARCLGREHAVRAAASGREALELIATGEPIDVLFLDVMMPEMTGIDLYRELERVAPELTDRVVFLTGGAFAGGMQEALGALPNCQLSKPFEPKDIRDAAQRVAAAQSRSKSP